MKVKRIMIIFLSIIGLLVISIFLVLKLNPAFGGKADSSQIESFEKLPHFESGEFKNQTKTEMDMGFSKGLKIMKMFLFEDNGRKPNKELPQKSIDIKQFVNSKDKNLFIWIGHSTILLNLKGKIIFIDPMLTNSPSPVAAFGTKRFNPNLPFDINDIPKIDLVLITHDHYDHLDMKSIKMIKDKTDKFLTPLAVKPHLKRWGVEGNKISEFDWWQNYSTEDIKFTFAPARHFSGRGTSNRNSTLWGSWIIESNDAKIFHSGDSGYGNHFKEINEKFGNFDFAFIECGQYNENWAAIHMAPEQSAQAALDLKADYMMPIHWGAFTLGLHSWNEPAIRAHNQANKLNQNIISPIIGEIIEIPVRSESRKDWWSEEVRNQN